MTSTRFSLFKVIFFYCFSSANYFFSPHSSSLPGTVTESNLTIRVRVKPDKKCEKVRSTWSNMLRSHISWSCVTSCQDLNHPSVFNIHLTIYYIGSLELSIESSYRVASFPPHFSLIALLCVLFLHVYLFCFFFWPNRLSETESRKKKLKYRIIPLAHTDGRCRRAPTARSSLMMKKKKIDLNTLSYAFFVQPSVELVAF